LVKYVKLNKKWARRKDLKEVGVLKRVGGGKD
jgi:hypothetical protein